MVLGLVEGLKKKQIRASLTLLSDLPKIDKERYSSIRSLEIIGRPWAKQKKGALLAIFTAFIYGLWAFVGRTFQSISGNKPKFQWGRLWCAYSKVDIVVDVSGDDLTTIYGWAAPLQVLFELFLAKLLGLKTVLLAQSLGPFDSPFMKVVAQTLPHLADLVTLRDSDSFRLWQQIVGEKNSRHHTPDHPLADLIHLNDMLKATEASDTGPIAINLSNYVVETALRLEKDGLGSTGLHNHFSSWADLLEHIHNVTGRELLLLPHTFRPGKGHDGYWLNRLYQKCPSSLPIREFQGPLSPHEICNIIAKSSFVVASRMHLALTALKCAVPFLAIAYSHKYQQLAPLSFFKISPVIYLNEHRSKPLFSIITQHFDSLWHNRQVFKTSIESYAQEAARLAEENLDYLLMTVNSSRRNG